MIAKDNKGIYELLMLNGNYNDPHIIKYKKIISLIKNPKKILDVGCGDGFFDELLIKNFDCEVYGIDISRKILNAAKRRGIKTIKHDLNKFPWPIKEKFDYIVAGDIIEHLYDGTSFVKECRRLLKKGGKLIISTPNINSYHNRFLILIGKYPLWMDYAPNKTGYKSFKPTGHIRVFNIDTLKELLTENKFKIKKIVGCPLLNPNKTIIYKIGNFFEKLISKIPSLASLIIVEAEK